MIKDPIERHEVLLPVNHNVNNTCDTTARHKKKAKLRKHDANWVRNISSRPLD